jgi:uncharacterized repeat protein (TIGR01451 family)
METVATPKSRGRRIGLLALIAAAIALGLTIMPMTAGAVHNGPFELDGNAVDDSASGLPDDWGTLFPTDNSSSDLGHSFVTDKGETGLEPDDGYGSGLTKDTQDVPNWSSVNGAISPEKDDILHAYAATYVSAGDQLLYFGQDRAPKPNGSTAMGFWFFQDRVAPDGAGGFTGEHRDGDVLVTSDMAQGGSVSVVNIFRWENGALHSLASLANAECGPNLPPESEALACGKANEQGPIDVPWPYPSVDNPDQVVPQNIFFEGGINLSNLFQDQAIPCFSSFLANTRTSPSETADLKDFVAGTLDTCGTITVHKNATPKSAQAFSFDANGAKLADFELSDPTAGADASDTKVFTGLQPGDYSISEDLSQTTDWTNTDLVCTREGPNTLVDTTGDGTGRTASMELGLAGNVDCTFFNELKPRVKLIKELDPAADPGRFDLTLNGTTYNDGGQGFGDGGTTGFVTVPPGSVTIAESAHAGTAADRYASQISCDSGKGSATGTGHGFSIANGESVTCTFKNHRKRGKLIVKKLVVNDDGGAKVASDFSFSVNGGSAVGFEADGENELSVDAGTYDVTEPAVAGYATSYNNCHDLVVQDGGTATCTVTNDDEPAKLIVKKVVVNDDGGAKVASDFSFKVNDDDPVAFEADGENALTVPAGTYSVTEPAVAGYATSYEGCSDVVIPNGGTATCTVTNDDSPAELIVIKHVVNDDGGTLKASDFHIAVTGTDASPSSFAGAEAPGTNVGIGAGSYNVSEIEDPGYDVSYSADCSGSISNGETKTCTITNDDKPATLIVEKVVVNDDGGKKVASDFSFKVNDGSAVGFEADGQNTLTVPAGTYDVSEPADEGYATSYEGCSEVVIPNGGTATCTITNDDKPATLIVKKVVVNDEGGTKKAEDFTFSVNGAVPMPFEADGQNNLTVPAGTYNVTEPAFGGYATSYEGCSNVVIPNGGTATCTITNDDDIPPTVNVTKDANVQSMDEPGGDVIFTVTVWNTSHEAVTLTSLVDSVYGNLDKDDVGNHSWVSSLCETGGTIEATDGTRGGEDTYACTFVGSVKGEGPAVHENEVTAVVTDDEDDTATGKDTAAVLIKDVPPPPPPPPAPQIDLSVTKVDAPDPAKLNGQIGYTMLVRNAGPSTATGVTLADPLPAGTSFVSVKTTQGTCSYAGGLVQCSLGTIQAGGTVTVTLIVKATRAGVVTNEVTVVGKEPEPNTANNKASATTLVPTPLVPPKKPKPVCSTLTVGPKSLRVGKRSTIAATVKNRGKAVKGVKVRVRGAGILKSGRTNARGKAHITVRPVRPGIVVVSVPQKLVCGSKRIGVVGVFEPPVTG